MGWAVFVSGRGSNLAAIMEAVSVRVVVTNKPDCPAARRSRRAGIEVLSVANGDWTELDQQLRSRAIDKIFLAGFMKLIPESFLTGWSGSIFNIHPSLLPLYKGLSALKRAHAEKGRVGASVHHVIAEMDGGQVILQKEIPWQDDFQALKRKLHMVEHKIVREVIQCKTLS